MNFHAALMHGLVPKACTDTNTNTNTNEIQVDTSAESKQCANSSIMDYAKLRREQRMIDENRKRVQAEKDAQEVERALEEAIAKAEAERRALDLKSEAEEETEAEAEGAFKVDEAANVGVGEVEYDDDDDDDDDDDYDYDYDYDTNPTNRVKMEEHLLEILGIAKVYLLLGSNGLDTATSLQAELERTQPISIYHTAYIMYLSHHTKNYT